MKKVFILLALLYASISQTYAQSPELIIQRSGNPDSLKQVLLSGLNLSEVNSGFLIDKSVPIISTAHFSSKKTLSDTNLVNLTSFSRLYAVFFGAGVNGTQLPHPDTIYNFNGYGDTIPFLLMSYRYHHFNHNAIQEGLLTYSGGVLHDVPNRPNSPYICDTIFAMTPYGNYYQKKSLSFKLAADKLLNNLGVSIQQLTIDWDDSTGTHNYAVGDIITVNYNTNGLKRVSVTYTFSNGKQLAARFELVVDAPDPNRNAPPPLEGYRNNPTILNYTINRSGHDISAKVAYFSACEDDQIRKPLIYLDGFDPKAAENTNDYSKIRLMFNYDKTHDGEKFSKSIFEEGYDVFFVDWGNTHEDMRDNAALFQMILEDINVRKKAAGSTEKNVVIGLSMGGIIGKGVLRSMEIAGKDHECKYLFTYDSPLRGANIPLSVQMMVSHLGNTDIAGIPLNLLVKDKVSKRKSLLDIEDVLKTIGAKQMLIYNLWDIAGTEYTNFQNEFHAMGALTKCEEKNISNGSLMTTDQGFGPNVLYMDVNIDRYAAVNGAINPGDNWFGYITAGIIDFLLVGIVDLQINSFLYTMPTSAPSLSRIYEGDVTQTWFNIITIDNPYVGLIKGSRFNAIDNCPGGSTKVGDNVLPPAYGHSYFSQLTHIPTLSALNIGLSNLYANPFSIRTDVDNFIGSFDAVPGLDTYYDRKEFKVGNTPNQEHVSYSERIMTYLQYYLTTSDAIKKKDPTELFKIENRTYNFGTGTAAINFTSFQPQSTNNRISNTVYVQNNGKLWINRNGRISFMDVATNPSVKTNSDFKVYLNKQNRCGVGVPIVTVYEGGELIVGDNSIGNTGELIIGEGGRLNISGGTAFVESNSIIRIQKGGKLTIDKNLLELQWGGKIIVEYGGELIINEGGILQVSHYSQVEVKLGGKLIINPLANIRLWDGSQVDGNANILIENLGELVINGNFNYTGNGFFQFDNGNKLTINSSSFKLEGLSKDHRFIRINNGAILEIPSEKTLDLKNGKVEYTNRSRISLLENSTGVFTNVKFDRTNSYNTSIEDNRGIYAYKTRYIHLDNCKIQKLNKGLEGNYVTSANGIFIENSLLESPIIVDNVTNFNAQNSDFYYDGTIIGNHLTNGNVDNCHFYGTHSFNAITLNNFKYFNLTNSLIRDYRATDENAVTLANGVNYSTGQFLARGCTFDNNNFALVTPTKSSNYLNMLVNMYISECSFSNNDIAIRNRGGVYNYTVAYNGLVSLDCSRFDNNYTCVEGENVKLVIDINKNRPNKFFASYPQLFFNICYGYGVPAPATISAKYQYWSYNGLGGITPDNTMYLLGDCPGGNNTTLDASNKLTAMVACTPLPTGGKVGFNEPDRVCTVTSSSTPVINERFADGYEQLMNGSWSSAEYLMQPIADLTSNLLPASQPICNVYVDYARHLVVPHLLSPSNSTINSRDNNVAVINVNNIKIYPNPATNGFTISTDGELNQVEVFNTLGQKVFNKTIPTNSYYLNTSDWESGIYIVKTKDLSGDIKTAKVFVQKEKN